MRALLLLTISLSVLLGVLTQEPQPCKAPPYLEGKLLVVFPEGKTLVFEQFYYDAVEQRIRVIAHEQDSTHNVFVDRLLLFRERFYYEISYHNKSCTKVPFSAAFSPIEIPIDAHHKAQFVIGSLSAPAQGLLVNNWEGSIAEIKANYSMTFTEFGCIPVTILYSVEKTGHIVSSFFDIVIGIENPDIFIPPSFCTSAKLVERKPGEVADFFRALL
ncbi:ependymin [Colossoma macropomum]|uniref:ependymin n=1 Tax=Colossoma macropomum TaxID=42526 RepID=UPI00186416F8|nr:ependymin [Colossoma macropomum]